MMARARGPSGDNSSSPENTATVDKDEIHFITCGSTDCGKSTLIGRLLWDGRFISDDQLGMLQNESRPADCAHDSTIDFSQLVDGQAAEREQGIKIDVACRYFQTDRRNFVVTDAPDHPQFTRQMATEASNADLAVIVVDALQGVRTQTRRHMTIAQMLGIRHFVFAVNKMDLADWDEARFREVEIEVLGFAEDLEFRNAIAIPVSALQGDNVFASSSRMAWYQGPTLMAHLESIHIDRGQDGPFRFPVQRVNRAGLDSPEISGTVRGGVVRPGDALYIWPAGSKVRADRVFTDGLDFGKAADDDALTIVLDSDADVSQGDIITRAEDETVTIADQFQAKLLWVGDEKLVPERSHLIRFGMATTTGRVMTIKHRIEFDTLARLPAHTLECNDMGVVTIMLDRALLIDNYAKNRTTGSFAVIDQYTNAKIAIGTVEFPLRRSTNIIWHRSAVDKALRASNKSQRPRCLWFTGFSGSGKSTLANMFDRRLTAANRHTYVLDGDNVRHGLNHDLGFTESDRVENTRRMAEVAKLMVDAGLIVLVCAISPYRRDRKMARSLFESDEFVEVFVDTPIEECEARDPKGLYRKARKGEIPNFTGISAPYERPEDAEIHLDGTKPVEDLVDVLVSRIEG